MSSIRRVNFDGLVDVTIPFLTQNCCHISSFSCFYLLSWVIRKRIFHSGGTLFVCTIFTSHDGLVFDYQYTPCFVDKQKYLMWNSLLHIPFYESLIAINKMGAWMGQRRLIDWHVLGGIKIKAKHIEENSRIILTFHGSITSQLTILPKAHTLEEFGSKWSIINFLLRLFQSPYFLIE